VADQNYLVGTWAGAGSRGGSGSWSINSGAWDIPTVSQPSEAQGEEGGWNSASWIGIDGFNEGIASNDVLQAGVAQRVDANGNASYNAWYEWFAPAVPGSPSYIYQTDITNLEVSPGHQLVCAVYYQPFLPSLSLGTIILINATTEQGFSLLLYPPPGATFAGNTVEWIMEAPDGGEPISSLPKFTPVVFTGISESHDGAPASLQNVDTLNIENAAGTILTSVTVGNDTVSIDFIG
jgi:hypothetical protein